MAVLMTMLGQTVGFPVPEGGAGELPGRWPAGRVARRRHPYVDPGDRHRRTRRPRRRRTHGGRGAGAGGTGRAGRRRRAEPLRRTRRGRGPPRPRASRDEPIPARPGHREGRLGARRAGALGEPAGGSARHRARRRLGRADRRGVRAALGRDDPGRTVPAPRSDERRGSHAVAGGHGGVVGLHARAAARRARRGRRRPPRDLGRVRARAVRGPDAGTDRTARAGLRRAHPCPRVLGPRELETRDANLVGGAINGARRPCTSSSSSDPCRAPVGPRRASVASTWPRPPPTPGAASTAPRG